MKKDDTKNFSEEEREKIREICKKIVDDFPLEKYQKLVDALKEVMNNPKMKQGITKYLEEISR